MAPSLTQPQGQLSAADALHLAQQAPSILRSNPRAISSSPLSSLFSAKESPELWVIYNNLMLSCLRAGDDEAASECLERLLLRFGPHNERIMALKGLAKEATAENESELQEVLKDYEVILRENAANIPVAKRKVALLKSMGRINDATTALTALLDYAPIDAEAWAELSDLYLSQGLYSQAIYALEEVLVLAPNAWNLHAKLAEVLFMAANTSGDSHQGYLAESLKRFCRSIELCDDYLRGYYGLKKVTDQILEASAAGNGGKNVKKQTEEGRFEIPNRIKVEKLNQAATNKLAEI
ncbi:ER membrane protein complex subunit 2, partial [Geosmithia morbida]